MWLCFLKTNYPDYYDITISIDCLAALPVDRDISVSVISVIDDTLGLDRPIEPMDRPVEPIDAPPNSQSIVLSLDQDTIEANLILEEITGRRPPTTGIPVPSIRYTPINEASGRERILSLAFPTLYPTGQADLNTPRLRNIPLIDYARHLLCWYDQRFARYAYWRFFVFNIYIRQRVRSTAHFYVSRISYLKGLTCKELAEALNIDTNLLLQIVYQGAFLPGTRLYWRNCASGLQAYACFLSQSIVPIFVTFSCTDIQ